MQAGRLLLELGYQDVVHYAGGMEDWTAHHLPVDTPPPPPSRNGVAARRRRTLVDVLGSLEVGHLAALWVCVVLGFGTLYYLLSVLPGQGVLQDGRPIGYGWNDFMVNIYFSAVTATSIGYGDVVPIGWVRPLSVVEAVFELLIFGVVVSKFVSRRQEELLIDTHSTLFEARLSRVRTSLHLVLMELQAIADLCGNQDIPKGRLLHRVESTATLFSGELRAIHNLLFRPFETPDESALQGILGSLQAGMEELVNVLLCLPASERRSPGFCAALEVVATLSGEICGECVPIQYAAELRTQMDRIQSLGLQLRSLVEGAV
ncbi:MAG: ion channel [Candidatus Xenobia bacterium]